MNRQQKKEKLKHLQESMEKKRQYNLANPEHKKAQDEENCLNSEIKAKARKKREVKRHRKKLRKKRAREARKKKEQGV